MVKPSLKEKARRAPHKCGVYLWKDEGGRILYVGKALDLRKRLSDYFTGRLDPKTTLMVRRAHKIEWILTGNEDEALLLEDALVKNHQPRYNVRLRDDKRYPYLKLTLGEKYPRLMLTRRIIEDGSRYFGPYTDVGAVRRTMKLLSRLFGVRVCGKNPEKSSSCLNYHMGRCLAPCEHATKEEYDSAVSNAIDFLIKNPRKTISSLKKQMKAYSDKQMYERAQKLKSAIADVEALSVSQKVAFPNLEESDFIGYANLDNRANITVLKVRRGYVVATLHYSLTGVMRFKAQAAVKVFVKQYYVTEDVVPENIYVSHTPTDHEALTHLLSELKSRRVKIKKPVSGRKKKLVELARENSLHELENRKLSHTKPKPEILLRKLLGLPETPKRIEGYD
ncbi:MAG: excinuclease ABC subunit C, partial [Candidatus Altiarchaeales archaeon]|nr:excinuclease ABC subunit C [Candidatus Altiarchaeales archaeon]